MITYQTVNLDIFVYWFDLSFYCYKTFFLFVLKIIQKLCTSATSQKTKHTRLKKGINLRLVEGSEPKSDHNLIIKEPLWGSHSDHIWTTRWY